MSEMRCTRLAATHAKCNQKNTSDVSPCFFTRRQSCSQCDPLIFS